MLPGFLTTALEIIIILDVCGAVVYFALTGLSRIKKQSEKTSPPLQTQSPVLQSLGIETPALATPTAIPTRISPTVYLPETPPETHKAERAWTGGIKHQMSRLKNAFTYRPETQNQAIETRAIDPDYAKLGRVLDSFKEET